MRQECSAEEIKVLNKAMWGIVAELKALIAPNLPQDFQPLAGRKADRTALHLLFCKGLCYMQRSFNSGLQCFI